MPSIVSMPMRPHNAEQCLNGKKTATSRPTAYGKVGDMFRLYYSGREAYFQITDVRKMRLGEVAAFHFEEEGFATTDEFIAEWNKIHPNKGYQPDWLVYYHEFKRKY